MQNIEIPQEYSAEDLELYRRIGYKDKPGILRLVSDSEKIRVAFPSWEVLVNQSSSSWAEYMRDPYDVFNYRVRWGLEKQENEELWVQIRERNEREAARRLQEAESIDIRVDLSSKRFSPVDYLRFNPRDGLPEFYPVQLGLLIAVVKPSRQEALSLANAKPWGRNSGLKQLANITGKPVIAEAGEGLRMEFLPG